jgi:hypothetical protein
MKRFAMENLKNWITNNGDLENMHTPWQPGQRKTPESVHILEIIKAF